MIVKTTHPLWALSRLLLTHAHPQPQIRLLMVHPPAMDSNTSTSDPLPPSNSNTTTNGPPTGLGLKYDYCVLTNELTFFFTPEYSLKSLIVNNKKGNIYKTNQTKLHILVCKYYIVYKSVTSRNKLTYAILSTIIIS